MTARPSQRIVQEANAHHALSAAAERRYKKLCPRILATLTKQEEKFVEDFQRRRTVRTNAEAELDVQRGVATRHFLPCAGAAPRTFFEVIRYADKRFAEHAIAKYDARGYRTRLHELAVQHLARKAA